MCSVPIFSCPNSTANCQAILINSTTSALKPLLTIVIISGFAVRFNAISARSKVTPFSAKIFAPNDEFCASTPSKICSVPTYSLPSLCARKPARPKLARAVSVSRGSNSEKSSDISPSFRFRRFAEGSLFRHLLNYAHQAILNILSKFWLCLNRSFCFDV